MSHTCLELVAKEDRRYPISLAAGPFALASISRSTALRLFTWLDEQNKLSVADRSNTEIACFHVASSPRRAHHLLLVSFDTF